MLSDLAVFTCYIACLHTVTDFRCTGSSYWL